MAKKKKYPKVHKVDPKAISIRSMAVSCCTVLFDDSNLAKLNKAGFDLTSVAFTKSPKKEYDKLRRWAGRGTWVAVASAPEILDGDGVPSLDLVIESPKKRGAKSKHPSGPKSGIWFDPVTSLIDLSSGQLRVVYEDEFFHDGFEQDENMMVVEKGQDGVRPLGDLDDPYSYLISCPPGMYEAHAFTRFSDEMSDHEPPEGGADLAIYLVSIQKPASFRMSIPLLPTYPASQDVVALRRKAAGLPESRTAKATKPKLLKDGSLSTHVTELVSIIRLDAPKKLLNKMGVEPGVFLALEVGGKKIRGLVSENETPDPSVWAAIEKEKKKPGSFALFTRFDEYLNVNILKQGRKDRIEMVSRETAPATLSVIKNDRGQPLRLEMKSSAVNHPNAVQVPKRVGRSEKKVEKLIPIMERCFSWIQVCVFELDGKTKAVAIHVQPPQFQKVDGKKKEILSGEVRGVIATYVDGHMREDQSKGFQGYPDSIPRAFDWLASQTKGGWVWNNRFELHMDFWNQSGKKPSKAKAEAAAIEAWNEVLGIQ